MKRQGMGYFKWNLPFRFLAVAVLGVLLLLAGCQSKEDKLDEIQSAGFVKYGDKIYRVKSVDYKVGSVTIIAPDGVAIPVPVETVEPSEGQ